MDYYELTSNVYRIQAGVGSDGEIYGGVLLKDDPNILIGASGGTKLVQGLLSTLTEIKNNNKLRVYLPNVTFEELITIELIQKQLPDTNFFVHVDIIDKVRFPREYFMENRYYIDERDESRIRKQLPKELKNIYGFDKSASFETQHTKILLIPFSGPHQGHSFIYSRDHKLLCAGLILGRTSDPFSYFFDNSGSLEQYFNALSFLEKARSEIIFPSYNEPEFTKNLKYKVDNVREAIKDDLENILNLLSLTGKSLEQISQKYMDMYGQRNLTRPYDMIDLNMGKIFHLLDHLVREKKVIKQEDQYILNKPIE